MKIKRIVLLIFSFMLTSHFSFCQTKRALIFAIGNYPDESGWPVIASDRDEALIKKALENQKFTDIKLVQDQDATVAGIKNSLNELINRSNPGDIVIIHFSSHGEQVEDLAGNKPDGLEESIVGFDGKLPPYGTEPTKEEMLKLRDGYFLDDAFGLYVDKLRAKLGKKGDVLVLMDLCYAGTGTRGVAKVRGGKPPLVSRGFYIRKHKITDGNKPVLLLPDDKDLAPYVVIGASRADEADNEMSEDGKHNIGPLTYATAKALAAVDTGMTYRTLFANIQSVMNGKLPQQHPVLSGNGLDRRLFGGNFVVQKPYLLIDNITGRQMVVRGGTFAGLDAGAKVSLYPAGTNTPVGSKPLANGTVIAADLYSARVQLDADPALTQAAMGWVFVTEQVFKTDALEVGIGNTSTIPGAAVFSPNQVLRIQKALKSIPGVKPGPAPTLSIVKGKGTFIDSLIITATGQTFDTVTNASKDTLGLKNKIRAFIQYSFLKELNVTDREASLEVTLVPLVNGQPDTTSQPNELSFNAGSKFLIWVKNKSRTNLYLNILDLQPNGVINAILPNRDQRIFADDLMIPSGNSFLFKNYVITVTPPFGKEVFKVFAATDKIDLEDITNSRGVTKRGNLRPFENLVQKSYEARSVSIGDASGSSFNLYFDIKPAQ
jgi:hypothetical protein